MKPGEQWLAELDKRRPAVIFRAVPRLKRNSHLPNHLHDPRVDLVDFVEIACEVTGLDTTTVVSMANLDLADSIEKQAVI